jgi:hypothetical protein
MIDRGGHVAELVRRQIAQCPHSPQRLLVRILRGAVLPVFAQPGGLLDHRHDMIRTQSPPEQGSGISAHSRHHFVG